MQPDSLLVREHEFHLPHRVGGPGLLPQPDLDRAIDDSVPIDRHRVEDGHWAELIDKLVALPVEVGAAFLHHLGGERAAVMSDGEFQ